jgi:hypothetical protein
MRASPLQKLPPWPKRQDENITLLGSERVSSHHRSPLQRGDVDVTGNITSSNPLDAGTANPLSVSEDLRAHLLRAGINYRFQAF